jgi:predicted RNase H-like HicB family nuclease
MDAYTVILSPDPDSGGYSVSVPAMPGAITEGATREATISAIAEVMATWLDIARSEGYDPLMETPETIGRQVASVIEDRQAEGWDTTIETTLVRPAALVA